MSDFAELFDSFIDRAFRFETLPTYCVNEETEALAAFEQGLPVPEGWLDEWVDFVRDATNMGKSVVRVRLIPEPETMYYKFEESHGYTRSISAGESIFAVTAAGLPPRARTIGDFWLFDDTVMASLNYDSAGRFIKATVDTNLAAVNRMEGVANDLLCVAQPIRLIR